MDDDPGADDLVSLFDFVASRALGYRRGLAHSPAFPSTVDPSSLRAAFGALADEPESPVAVLRELADAAAPGLVASAGPRYFGFVTGGSLEAATGADMLAVAWDQNAFNSVTSPAAAAVEEVTAGWLLELLGLPASASVGFVTGAQGANTVCLAAARHHVLAQAGWDVERDGLAAGPPLRVVATSERHATIDRALRLLGLGTGALEPVATAGDGSIDTAALAGVLSAAPPGPTIVCLQAGNVNTGACDDFVGAVAAARAHGAWVHVDGAFGLWAGASSATRHLVEGVSGADSWATDGHKWLNVPYDCGYAVCAHPASHRAAMALSAAYLTRTDELRSPADFVPESSRRARGFATWAALRQLGRHGVDELVGRCCGLARRLAGALAAAEGVTVVNDVVLNQVLVRFGDDVTTEKVVEAVQANGSCWMGATTWSGMRLMRISLSGASTTESDVDLAVSTILRAFASVRAADSP